MHLFGKSHHLLSLTVEHWLGKEATGSRQLDLILGLLVNLV